MKSSYERQVGISDLDYNGKMSFGKIIDFIQDSSNRQSNELGLGIKYQTEKRRAWILSSWHISFEKMKGDFPGDSEKLVVSTWPYSFNKLFGIRNYSIARAADASNYIVEAQGTWFVYDVDEKTVTKIDEEDREKYDCVDEKLDLQKTSRKIKAAEDYEKKDKIVVRKYHLDINNHMNNAWYIKIAEEFVDNKEEIKYLRIEYKLSAQLGDEVIPYVCYDNNRIVVELRSKEDVLFAICEFVK